MQFEILIEILMGCYSKKRNHIYISDHADKFVKVRKAKGAQIWMDFQKENTHKKYIFPFKYKPSSSHGTCKTKTFHFAKHDYPGTSL